MSYDVDSLNNTISLNSENIEKKPSVLNEIANAELPMHLANQHRVRLKLYQHAGINYANRRIVANYWQLSELIKLNENGMIT